MGHSNSERNTFHVKTVEYNKKLMENFYNAFSKGEFEEIFQYVTPDFVMHVPGKGLNAGEYWYKEGFKKFLDHIVSFGGGVFSLSIPAIAVNVDSVFTREQIRMNRKENPEELWLLQFVMEYKIKDGLIAEAWTIPIEGDVYDTFWTPGSKFKNPSNPLISEKPQTISESLANSYSLENEKIVRDFYHYFWNSDLDSMAKNIVDDFELWVPGNSFLSGTYKTKQGYLAFRDKLLSNVAGDRYKLDWESFACSEKEVFVKEHIRMNRSWDEQIKTNFAVFHFQLENGKIIRINDIPLDAIAYDDFFTKK
ncbi:nuclear transport factor 2 family protein [Sphingobacterium sp. JUb78]|uniref:nuclear transport factor 2 family protein n=2 Tax=Sphingobacterium TaxID=28453 RepID=UPI0010449A49|nr:nuclear transport factor 2 family protein [Sphingobacterium sp. JUb78]MCW2264029.1 ketosteroid isomerase-like protein [Sphingobacterium kitahiroshimense]TCR14985.1 ketosteroid isomerase-like protein [Sphingobacterium sp. JUb78]